MTEDIKMEEKVEPQTEQTENSISDTTPKEKDECILIPLKFNKEVKQLTVDEAALLAQKGMKYDIIREDYDLIKSLALAENKSVSDYISDLKDRKRNEKLDILTAKCGGDKDLAERIVKLEEEKIQQYKSDLDEVREYFPKVKSIEDLPESVTESAKLKGKSLLDEYLRFLLKNKINEKEIINKQKSAGELSLGSHQDCSGVDNPETAEFLKGLWR